MATRVRILPIFIAMMVVLFSVKLGSIWQDASKIEFGGGIEIQSASAQQTPEAQPAEQQATPILPQPPKSDAAPAGGVPVGARAMQETSSAAPVVGDPNRFSEREIQLLQELAERRHVLESRERELEEREALLKAAEQRLVEKQNELNTTKTEIMSLLKQQDKQEQAKVKQLVAIYENMKPKDAANIFNELEMPVLLQVVKNMKERKVAPVIASMSAEKARALTKELAELQKLPKALAEDQSLNPLPK